MSHTNNFPTRHYFIGILLLGSLLFSLFSLIIYQHYEASRQLTQTTLYNYEVARQSRKILMDLVDMETGVRGYLLTGEGRFLDPYKESQRTMGNQINLLRAYSARDPALQSEIDGWIAKIKQTTSLLQKAIEENRVNGKGSYSLHQLDVERSHMDELRQTIDGFVANRVDIVNEQIAISDREEGEFLSVLIIGTVGSIAAMVLAIFVIIRLGRNAMRVGKLVIEAEDRFRLVMNGLNDGLYDYKCSPKEVYFSPAFKSMLGYADDEFENSIEALEGAIHPDDREDMWKSFYAYQAQETNRYINTFRMRHKEGEWRWILSRGLGFWDVDGTMTRLVGTHTDITEQKIKEEEVTQLNKELETFIYIASHDLRSPLVNLKGFAGELRHSTQSIEPIIRKLESQMPPEDAKKVEQAFAQDIPEALKFIESSTDRMDNLTTAVLDLSRIGKRELKIESIDTKKIITKCIESQTYEINRKGATIEVEEMPIIYSDHFALEQIFSNLIDNAVKYLDPARPGKIVISGHAHVSDVVFMVQDNGRGIDKADKEKIFEMFRRARNSSDVRGTGMGMSFVKATVRRLGGIIWYESTPNVGTTFFVRLPVTVERTTK